MEGIEKSILLKIGKENGVKEKGLFLLEKFIDGEWEENASEAFIFAAVQAGLIGNSSIVIAERLRCEKALNIYKAFKKIKVDFKTIDALDERLMIEREEDNVFSH